MKLVTSTGDYKFYVPYNMPYQRKTWEHNGKNIEKLVSPSLDLKKKAVDLLYETGKYILQTYDCFEE